MELVYVYFEKSQIYAKLSEDEQGRFSGLTKHIKETVLSNNRENIAYLVKEREILLNTVSLPAFPAQAITCDLHNFFYLNSLVCYDLQSESSAFYSSGMVKTISVFTNLH